MTEEISTSWHKYPSIYALGHSAIVRIFDEDVLVEEKIDGSQFSFGSFNGELRCRSKGSQINLFAPEKMFLKIVEVVKGLHEKGMLIDGWTYRGEYLAAPKHNTLAYDRIPANHFIGFDINTGHEVYMDAQAKAAEFARLGFECVPAMFKGKVLTREMFRELLEQESCLGGQKVEGVVVKCYNQFTIEKKAMMGKFVSEAFKEAHDTSWKERNPKSGEVVLQLIDRYRTPARWAKAVQHLKERGELQDAPQDIGPLFKEIACDVRKECESEMKDILFEWAWGHVHRGITGGMPQWYKEQLLNRSLNEGEK